MNSKFIKVLYVCREHSVERVRAGVTASTPPPWREKAGTESARRDGDMPVDHAASAHGDANTE